MKKVNKLIALILCLATVLSCLIFPTSAIDTQLFNDKILAEVENLMEERCSFTDIKNHWARDYIRIAALAGYMNGIGNNKFNPDGTITRAMVAQVLYNLEGAPSVSTKTPFNDVASSAWYAKAVAWAYSKGVTTGTSKTTFAPNQNVTNEQFLTFLYRYLNYKGYAKVGYCHDSSRKLANYSDMSDISPYAEDSFVWAVQNNIVGSGNKLFPKANTSRAEMAMILVLFSAYTPNPDKNYKTLNSKATEYGDKTYKTVVYIKDLNLTQCTKKFETAFANNGFSSGELMWAVECHNMCIASSVGRYDGFVSGKKCSANATIETRILPSVVRETYYSRSASYSGKMANIYSIYENINIDSLLIQDVLDVYANILSVAVKNIMTKITRCKMISLAGITVTYRYQRNEENLVGTSGTNVTAKDSAEIYVNLRIGYQ